MATTTRLYTVEELERNPPEGLLELLDWVLVDGGFVLFPGRQTMRAPAVAFVRADRMPTKAERDRFPRLAPDRAVEVLDPDDRPGEALAKVGMDLEAGVRLVWLVDPRARAVTVVTAGAAPLTLDAEAELTGGDVLPGFAVPVAAIFA